MIKEYRDNTLYFDGCNTVELAKEYGTPMYIMSQTDMIEKIQEVKDCFTKDYPRNRIAYACKAFCTRAMLGLAKKEGLCIDVVSAGELLTAISIDYPPEHIEFNGNNKLPSELELALDYGVGRIVIDGLQELALIERICKEKGKIANVLYRITPEVSASTHDYVNTGKKDSKFGIPLDMILPACEAAIQSPYVDFYGIHFHVGSQIFDNATHLAALEVTLYLVSQIKELYQYDVKELNIGGGFGAVYTDEQRQPFSYFLTPMMNRIVAYYKEKDLPLPAVVTEPGRSIVAEAGLTLYTIGSIKEIKDVRTYVSVDGGASDNIRPALYGSKYDGVIASKVNDEKTELVTICGKCCDSGDILIKDIQIAKPEAGDVFATFSTGAYGYSFSLNFNRNPMLGVVFVKDGTSEIAVKKQTFEQILQNDLLPASLT